MRPSTFLRIGLHRIVAALCLPLIIATGCNEDAPLPVASGDMAITQDGPGVDGPGCYHDLLLVDLLLLDLRVVGSVAVAGVECDGVQCKPDEFCIVAAPGLPPNPEMGPPHFATCQAVPDCAAAPTCACFAQAQNNCRGW